MIASVDSPVFVDILGPRDEVIRVLKFRLGDLPRGTLFMRIYNSDVRKGKKQLTLAFQKGMDCPSRKLTSAFLSHPSERSCYTFNVPSDEEVYCAAEHLQAGCPQS